MNLSVSHLSKDQRCSADFFFLSCKDIFLGSKAAYAAFPSLTPSAAHTSSHSALPVSPSLELPDKPDWELAQVNHAFVFLYSSSTGAVWFTAWPHINSCFARVIGRKVFWAVAQFSDLGQLAGIARKEITCAKQKKYCTCVKATPFIECFWLYQIYWMNKITWPVTARKASVHELWRKQGYCLYSPESLFLLH